MSFPEKTAEGGDVLKEGSHLLGALFPPESSGLVGMPRVGRYRGHPPSWEGGRAMEIASGAGFGLFFFPS